METNMLQSIEKTGSKSRSNIMQRAEELEKLCTELHEAIDILNKRLEPALTPGSPDPSPFAEDMPVPRQALSHLAEIFERRAESLQECTRRVRDLINRIEL